LKRETFARDATGLTKPFSLRDTLIILIGAINLGSGTLLLYSTSLAFAPSYNYVLSLFIAMILTLFVVLTYTYITTIMPRSGGDYVFVSRSVNPVLGFGGSFFWTVFAILGIAWNCLFMATTAISNSLAVGGYAMNNSAMVNASVTATEPVWEFVISLVTILVIMALMVFDPKWLKTFNLIAFVLGMLAVIAWLVVLGTTSQSTFANSFNAFAQPYMNTTNSYQAIISSASSNGLSISTGWGAILAATFASLPISYFTLGGANVVNFFSGEVKQIGRTALIAPLVALLSVTLFDILIGAALFHATGAKFLTSLSYLAFTVGGTSYTLPTAPYLPLLVEITAPNIFMVVLTLVGMISWLYLLAMSFYLVASRNLFAWSFDGVISNSFSLVNPRTHTPTRSVLLISVVAIIGVAFYCFYSVAFSYSNFTTGYNTAWLIACLAAIVFPFIKKDMFQAQSGYIRRKIAGIPVLSLIGLVGAVSVLFMDYEVAINPGYAGIPNNLSETSLLLVGAVFVVGVILFLVARAYQKRRGLDLSLVYRQVPPE